MKALAVEREMPAQQWISRGAARVPAFDKADHAFGVGLAAGACQSPISAVMSWIATCKVQVWAHAGERRESES